MKIAINFGDNDYCYCFYGVLSTIAHLSAKYGTLNELEDKDRLCTIINEISYGIYLLGDGGKWADSKEYLRITPDKIHIDDEVDRHIEEYKGWCNSEYFVLDLNKSNGTYKIVAV